MHLHIRFLAFEMAVFTAVAGMLSQNTPEWEEAYKRRLFCEMRLNLMEAEDEQTAVEEVQAGADTIQAGTAAVTERQVVLVEPPAEDEVPGESTAGCEDVVQIRTELRGECTAPTANQEPDMGTQQMDVRPDPGSVGIPSAPVYTVDGERLDPGVDAYLYRRLCESNIGWFYPFALLIAYQESSFNPLAENPNGRDKGLFQFRIEFHPGLDWANPYAQVDLFVQMMANRANAGCDAYTMISRHNTSDFSPEINQTYINQVMGHSLQGGW